jgi:hydroxypyruvate reductase
MRLKQNGLRKDLTEIFGAALRSVDPYRIVKERLTADGKTLTVKCETGPKTFALERFDRVIVAGAGKASMKMAKALEEILGERITHGCVSVKEDRNGPLRRIQAIRAGHPVPDENSVKAADEIMRMAQASSKEDLARTLLIVLLSGGGSSLLVSPLRWRESAAVSTGTAGPANAAVSSGTPVSAGADVPAGAENNGTGARSLSLSDIQRTTDALLASGASINAMNCVRKHLSNITGGRLARIFHPATILVLVLSDVVGDRLDTIASGPAAPDDTTYADALAIVRRFGIEDKIPPRVLAVLEAGAKGRMEETPKRGDPIFDNVHNVMVGSNRIATEAAARKAAGLAYNTLVLSSKITGEAREVAKVLFGIAREVRESGIATRRGRGIRRRGSTRCMGFFRCGWAARWGGSSYSPVKRPACILAGGETTVTLRGNGKGGRNQELALSFLSEMEKSEGGGKGIWLLSASTDGADGPTDAAGAFASAEVLEKSRRLGLTPIDYLENNDSYTFYEKTGFLHKTGPTGTNVCDLQIILVP